HPAAASTATRLTPTQPTDARQRSSPSQPPVTTSQSMARGCWTPITAGGRFTRWRRSKFWPKLEGWLPGYPRQPMGVDAEGYGFPEHKRTIARLMDDVRVLSPAGVEPVAQRCGAHVGASGLAAFPDARKSALHAIA